MNPVLKLQRLPTNVWIAVTIFFLLLSIFGIIIISVIWYLATQLIYSYGVIIDAGSTSTKVYLYSWPEIASRTNGEVFEVEKCLSQPGISDFVDNVEDAYTGIKSCLEELLPKIPPGMRKKAFVYLGATAGMRLVEEINPNATSQIFEVVENYLLTTDLRFNKSLNDIKIISGVVEGVGAWISVNYLKGTLQNSKLSKLFYPKENKTYGALDLGGASTQITFVPDTKTNKMKEKTIRLYGYNYSVYSHSYLCYGKSQAQFRLLAHLIQNITDTNLYYQPVKNPCMLKGDSFVYHINDILTEPCMFGQYALKEFGYEIKYPPNLIRKIVNITFEGSGNVDMCQSYIDKLFHTQKCDFETCSFNNIYRPKLTDRFLAFSGFDLVARYLKNRTKKNLTFHEFEYSSREYCKETPPTNLGKNMKPLRNNRMETYRKWRCFDFVYVFNLLKYFGFDKDNWKSIQFISKVNNANLGWSLGYMINKTSLVPIEEPIININLETFMSVLIICLCLLSLGLVFVFLIFRRLRSSNPIHLQIEEADLCIKNATENESL